MSSIHHLDQALAEAFPDKAEAVHALKTTDPASGSFSKRTTSFGKRSSRSRRA